MPDDKKVVKTPAGRYVEVPAAEAGAGEKFGAREATPEEVTAERQRLADEDKYGGVLGAAAAGVESFAAGAIPGYDLIGRGLFGDEFVETRRKQKEYQPVASVLGETGGIIAGPGKVAGKLGKAVETKAGGKLAGKVLGGAAEGVASTVNQSVSEYALSDDLSVENLVGTLTSNSLLNGGVGAAVGAAGYGLEKLLSGAKKSADKVAATAKKAATGDVTAMRAKAADDILDYHATAREDGRWLIADANPKAKAVLAKADRSIRGIADTPDALRANPGRAAQALEREEIALTKLRDGREAGLAKLADEEVAIASDIRLDLQTMPDDVAEVTLTGKAAQRYGSFADVKVSRKTPSVKVSREAAESFANAIEAGEMQGARAQAYAALDDSIGRVQQLRASLAEATAPAGQAAKAGLLEQAVSGSLFGATMGALPAMPFGGVIAPAIGAKVAGFATDLIFKRAGGAAASSAARTGQALGKLLELGPTAQKVAIPLSTAVLSQVRFAEDERRGPGRPPKKAEAPKGDGLVRAFRARESELRSQVETDAAGNPRMTPAARQKLGQRLAPIAQQDPILADRIETVAARRVEFVASKLPRRPSFMASAMGPDNWRPSAMEMRRFARYVAAAEDPGGVEERLAAGRISPEDAEAYEAVYPERLEALKMHLIQNLPQLSKQLPYAKRLALSMMTGVPLVPALQPEILRVLQGNYADEPGTEGGTAPPQAQPAFGSISKEKGTPAQERGAGQ